jgi:hypothetical protein
MFRHAFLASLALAALAPAAAHADVAYESPDVVASRVEPHRDRLYVSLGFVGTAMIDQKAILGDGASFGLGVKLSRDVALELGFLGTGRGQSTPGNGEDGFVLGAVTLDAKVRLVRGLVEPYLQVGVGEYFNGVVENMSADRVGLGAGFQVGGGVDIWAGSSVSFGLCALYRGVSTSTAGFGDEYAHAVTTEASIALHF